MREDCLGGERLPGVDQPLAFGRRQLGGSIGASRVSEAVTAGQDVGVDKRQVRDWQDHPLGQRALAGTAGSGQKVENRVAPGRPYVTCRPVATRPTYSCDAPTKGST